MSLNELYIRLAYAKDFTPHKVAYYEQLIKEAKEATTERRVYRVNWNGYPQPLGSTDFESVKAYIQHSLNMGGCKLSQFEIFDQFGQIKTNIVTQKEVDPTAKSSYSKLFN